MPAELGSTTPGVGHPSSSPQVSPLAVSNVLSQRGAFENAITAGPEAAAAAAVGLFPPVVAQGPADGAQSSRRNAIPGTQLMPSMANPPAHGDAPGGATPSSGTASGAGSKRPDRTQLLGAIPAGLLPRPGGSAPASSGGAPSASGSGPQHAQPAPAAPPPQAQSLSQPPHMAPQPGWNPAAPYGGPQFAPQQPPAPPPPAPAQPGYGFGYVPGSRVTVTWSNGQRYPGTVQQVSGSQCLVVFPDGQHHWVEMQYVAPA